MAQGKVESIPGLEDMISRAVAKTLGDPNLRIGGVTFGKVEHGQRVGKMDAVYATIKTRGAANEYEVPHTLGHPPGFCLLVSSENRQSPLTKYHVGAIRRDEWTGTTCRVDVTQTGGSMDGGELTFLVGGER